MDPGYFSAREAAAVTPHDTNALPRGPCAALYVGGAGAVAMRLRADAADVTFAAVPAGTTLFVEAAYVRATGTTATSIVALYD